MPGGLRTGSGWGFYQSGPLEVDRQSIRARSGSSWPASESPIIRLQENTLRSGPMESHAGARDPTSWRRKNAFRPPPRHGWYGAKGEEPKLSVRASLRGITTVAGRAVTESPLRSAKGGPRY